MLIMGIDPGYATVGYGIISFENGKLKAVDYGSIFTEAKTPFPARLEQIYDRFEGIFGLYKVKVVSVEKLYFQNNQKTAINVSQARGVIILSAQKAGAKICEYTPLEVKMSVTGAGRASKIQIMSMVKRLLLLKEIPKPDDTADALAVAVCHAQASGIKNKILERQKGVYGRLFL
ncbi:MAG: crossover junction endodeoxyribonuclease RuvC [Oscillospiraceae bacterium]|jgi:crossover junction endodeoxyribonuclease RuvC|nr:crossover junction endodeoxyribonuclease RuvC [Oscillospiraceae bacterium]